MYRRLLGSLREYKKDAILSPLLLAVEIVIEVFIPYIMAKLIDNGVEKGNMPLIWQLGALLLISAVVSMTFGLLSAREAARASAGFARNLRHDMFHNVQNYSFSNIDKFSTASIVTRLTTDISSIQNAFMMMMRVAVRAPLMMIFSLVMVLTINLKLSVIFLCAIPILAAGLYLIMHLTFPIFSRIFTTYDKLNNVVGENLHGIRVVKAFVREEHEKKKFQTVSESIYRDFCKGEKIMAFNMPLMQFSMYACILLVSWFGARMIVTGTFTTGELMSIFTYATQILMSLMMFSMVFVMLTISRAAMKRAVEILDEESDLHNGAHPIQEVPDGSIVFKNVSFSYSKRPDKLSLKNIDLDIKSGETVGILGGTGSSKSTLVQLIPRLYDATEGTVLVGGVDVMEYDIEALRDQVAMVLQKNVLFSGTIKENLRWGKADATDEELVRVCKLACADEFIREMPHGYDTMIEQGGANVSGGQKQRLCIARALLKKPMILILDDSTSAVDTATDAHIRQAFREEIPGTTKLIIAQRIASVQHADKIVVIDGGRIAAVGTHEELLETSPIYKEVYVSQVKGGVADAISK
jgi:ATP-binding cassette subfamily B multidrug efflux pump